MKNKCKQMIDNVVINARALSIITAMADVPRDRLMAAHMIIRLDLDKYVYTETSIVYACPHWPSANYDPRHHMATQYTCAYL